MCCSWPDLTAQKAYYVFHLLVADLMVPLIIMSVAYGLIAKTLWTGFKNMNTISECHLSTFWVFL